MSKTLNALFATILFAAVSLGAHAEMKPEMKADAEAINAACKSDAATAGCSGEVVGKGLLKCLHKYKEAHKDFKLSEGCRDAIKKGREDRMAQKK